VKTSPVYYQVKNNAGLDQIYSASIIIDLTKPVANAGPNQTVIIGTAVTLNASTCTDNYGIVSYMWDFRDGTNGTGMTATHTYANAGTFTAKLTVQDGAGNTAISPVTITVQDIIPEFPSVLALTIFMILVSVLALACKRKKGKCG
jgi:PKD repeat protein